MSEYPTFSSNGAVGPLLDHVQQVKKRDFADDDVRSAIKQVAEVERTLEAADKYGHAGVSQMESWNAAIKHEGPNVATKAGLFYATAPRPAPEVEEERNEDDFTLSARKAFRQESRKQTPEQRAAAVDGVRRLAEEHGGDLSVIDTFGKWHEQLQADPYGNAPRIQREIAERINGSIGMQQAHAHLAEYERQYRISAEERPVMQRMLTTGEAHSLPQAHALARQELALNVKDDIARDVTRASRQVQAPQPE